MDTLIQNGDFALDDRGFLKTVQATDELLQQALLRLTARKGAFALDKELGSELYKLRGGNRQRLNDVARGYVKQALLPISGLTVEDVQCAYTAEGAARLDVTLRVNDTQSVVSLGI
ncbi:hypothetical protein [Acetanaerobacterium elongatum]|uniref:Uncharacterized protein n=1 Tax=Acetanaerobacterium elongatum TaxID=258515 RepID=A0A1H0EKZ3_9FIRM|nr:hypothetical protein [Acetanaerobacterium elongatum]SDN83000.1 hypothetical protein SAMN05192585_13418 [Acetanaerobacterium elongatum]